MAGYEETLDLELDVATALRVCRESVLELNWTIVEEDVDYLIARDMVGDRIPLMVSTYIRVSVEKLRAVEDLARITFEASYQTTLFPGLNRMKKLPERARINELRNKVELKVSRSQHHDAERSSTGNVKDVVKEIERLAELRDRGVLTEEEFSAAKARLLEI